MSEIKGCPFCGSSNIGNRYVETYSVDSSYDVFGCKDCHAGFVNGTEEDWNARADGLAKLEAEAQALREEVARKDALWQLETDRAIKAERELLEQSVQLVDLRARVVVVPERLGTTTSKGLMDVMTLHHHLGWNACLDELARLNGKTVSEGLLRRAHHALDHAHMFIRNGIELGLIRMPDADTPDPAKCTPAIVMASREELRALLGEGKEHE